MSDRKTTSIRFLLSVLAVTLAPMLAFAGEQATEPADAPVTAPKKADLSPESIWKDFVIHVVEKGRADLLAVDHAGHEAPGEKTEETGADEEHAAESEEDHDHALEHGKDPIFPIVLRMSRELAVLRSLFPDADPLSIETADPAKDEERDRRVTGLLERLSADEDPYVRAYAELFRARQALESGRPREAVSILDELGKSRHFLGRKEAHRTAARAYREIGDDALAVLELRLFLINTAEEDFVDHRWASAQLKEIRESGKEGPLKESAEQAKSASILISARSAGAQTQDEQKRIEAILERAIKLLGEPSAKGDCCESASAGKACDSSCQERQGQVALGEQKRVEKILDGVIKILEGSCSACNGAATTQCSSCGKPGACTKCGSCASCGAGSGEGEGLARGSQRRDGRNGNGDPRGDRANEPAQDTKLRKGEQDRPDLRDPNYDSDELWGKINDREVARSLREVWGKIPVSYRRIVAQYYLDITELTPEDAK